MHTWSFLTNHARALLYIAANEDARLRDLAVGLDVTERTAYGIVADLADAGYLVKEREGRRNRYQIHYDVLLPDLPGVERTVGDLLAMLVDAESTPAESAKRPARRSGDKAR